MKYHIITFGCQMNEADSALMDALLRGAGWEPCENWDSADLVVVNTCSVREKPEHKVHSLVGQLAAGRAANPELLIAVTGCMAQRVGEELARGERGADIVLGTRAFHRITEAAARARAGERPVVITDMLDDPSQARGKAVPAAVPGPVTAFVPIIRGCTNFCTYCIVPHVRGPEKSRPPEEIGREVAELVRRGVREVTLLGQNVLAYGRDLGEGATFAGLLEMVNAIEGLWRIRFTTCHPRDVDARLVEAMRGLDKVCEHIHLPIQAGADKLLREMGRGYTVEDYRRVVRELRSAMPGLSITTDIMVGFPGESDEDFEESLRLYREIGFDAAFTFAYSPRPGTPAAARPDQVPREVKIGRLQRLIEMQNEISTARNRAQVGETAEVLVEGPAKQGEGLLSGRGRDNKMALFPGEREMIGSLVPVRLTEAHLWGFKGEAE